MTRKALEGRLAISINEFAACVGIGRNTVRNLLAAGDLKAKRIGTRVIIPMEEVERFLDELEEATP